MISAHFLLTALVVVFAPGTGVIYTLALGLGQGRRAALWSALGCTIGQGITGVSTLALGSIFTLVAIIFGSALTMKIQYYKMLHEDAGFGAALTTSLVDMKLLPASMRKLDDM